MAEWTMDDVAARFAEAAETARRLPRVRVQGYFNVWPEFKREPWEVIGAPDNGYRPLPPSPEAIERMLETMRWVQWLGRVLNQVNQTKAQARWTNDRKDFASLS